MLLGSDFIEAKQESRLVLRDIEYPILEMVLRFMYTGSLILSEAQQLLKLYQAGDRFDISALCKACLKQAASWLSFNTCVDMLMGSWRLGLSELHAYCENYVLHNFEAVKFSALLPVRKVE